MDLQKMFLTIMGYYDYPIQPAIIIYARYIDEAKEGLEKDDFLEVAKEMEEIISLRDFGVQAFKEKGVSDFEITHFFDTIKNVEKAANAKNSIASRKGLNEVEAQIIKFFPNSKGH